mmetsp:Transcript_80460/g.241041  ORF Transcript_80460/g.241041 Transcript_80460/m.241041 type:complete len:136 (+) Transcript_80460:442-849(+)
MIEGWVRRKGTAFPYQWRRRFARFDGHDGVLRVYASCGSAGVGALTVAVEVLDVRPIPHDRLGLLIVPSARTPNAKLSKQEGQDAEVERGGPPVRLRTETEEERERWVRVIADQIASWSTRQEEEATFTGDAAYP